MIEPTQSEDDLLEEALGGAAADKLYGKGLDIDAVLHQVYLRTGHSINNEDPIVAALIGNDILYRYMADAVRNSVLAIDGSNETLHNNVNEHMLHLRDLIKSELARHHEDMTRRADGRIRLSVWISAGINCLLSLIIVSLVILL